MDITNATEKLIAHGCNAQGVMGSGVALAIRNKWPKAYEDYKNHHTKFGLKVGQNIYSYTNKKIIANCITQEFYGRASDRRYVSYDGIAECMRKLYFLSKLKNLNVALPLIGARLGGGKWSIISKIIEGTFVDVVPNVYVLSEEEFKEIVEPTL